MVSDQQAERRKRTEEGAGLVEYVLLCLLIAIVCIVSVTYFGSTVTDRFSTVGSSAEAPAGP